MRIMLRQPEKHFPMGRRFLEAVLCPVITLQNGNDPDKADGLHKKVHDFCFIARSVNFPVRFAAKYLFA